MSGSLSLIPTSPYVDGEAELIAPSLLFYEVANALRYNPRFGVKEVKAALKALEDLAFRVYDFKGELATNAIETAYEAGITVYDGAYVALAEMEDAILYTADEQVVVKVSTDYVKHISEI